MHIHHPQIPAQTMSTWRQMHGLRSAKTPETKIDDAGFEELELTAMNVKEFIIQETTYLLATKQEVVGELVRCKDCKWFNDIGCAIRIVDDTDRPSDEDYCSFAERETDG